MIDSGWGDSVTLIDFGVAAPEGFCEQRLGRSPSGAPAYMVPEQVNGECTRSCDL